MKRGHVRPSRSQHVFSRAPQAKIPRSTFNRSHGVKTTFSAGYLVPVLVDEMLPGDTFNLKMHAFARMATPLVPIMDNLYLDSFFFAVPYRLLWDNFEKFMGYQVDPGDSTDFVIPTIDMPASTGVVEETLPDYFGIPLGVPDLTVDSLWFRAYNFIWNEWFRDENLQDSVVVDTDDGPDAIADYVLLKRGKRHDYFTSCLPFPQKGPDVELPLGTSAPVELVPFTTGLQPNLWFDFDSTTPAMNGDPAVFQTVTGGSSIRDGSSHQMVLDPNGRLIADLSTATAATINQLRLAFQTQKLLERDARGGTRYIEVVRSHFGVTSPDARLQRPEYLGGGSTPFIINPIAQTSATSGSDALGDLAAYGVCAPESHGFTYSATEHMVILGMVSVRADLNYQQGLNRMWSRQTRLDLYWPALSHIGEQEVLNKEIFADGTSADDDVFGYQERYAEYRYKPSLITGQFRSTAAAPIDFWHLAQDFASLPVLNDEFIQEDPPVDRVLAVDGESQFIMDAMFTYKCARPMPVYAVPGLIDHF